MRLGAASLLTLHQRRAEERRPFLDQVPGVAIGHSDASRRMRDLAGDADLIEQIEHHVHGLRMVVSPEAPDGIDLNANHAGGLFKSV